MDSAPIRIATSKSSPWIQIARGAVELNGLPLGSGDGAAVSDELTLELGASTDSETLLLELG